MPQIPATHVKQNNCATAALWGPSSSWKTQEHNAWKGQSFEEVGWKVVPLLNLLNAFICFGHFYHFCRDSAVPALGGSVQLSARLHSARRCRKSLCGFVSQDAINAKYFHTSETLATCPPHHQGKGSRTYSCWAVCPFEKAVSQQTRVEADTFAVRIWLFFEREI